MPQPCRIGRSSPRPLPVDGAKLLDALRQVFRRYIVLPPGADIALALWVLHAWTMDAGEISPFMVLVSPTKRCGKTSVMILLQYLTPRSELSSNITGPALFRYIEAVRPTLLIDEADSFVKDNEELRGILKQRSYQDCGQRPSAASRSMGEHKPRRFSTWAPKAIATISLPGRHPRRPGHHRAAAAQAAGERSVGGDNEWCAALRSQAARWSMDNFDKARRSRSAGAGGAQRPRRLTTGGPSSPSPTSLAASGLSWRVQACLTLSGESPEESLGVMLLADCGPAFGDDAVPADPERPWAEYNRGDPITQRQLAKLLGTFGIISVNVRPEVGPQGKGYRRVDFEQAWEAYCPGQIASRTDSDISIRPTVPRPVEIGTSRRFCIRPRCSSGRIEKMATCPITMRVGTLGRIAKPNLAREAVPPRLRPPRMTLAATPAPSRIASSGTGATTVAERSVSRTTTPGPAGLTASGCTPNARPPWFDSESPSARRAS